MGHYDILTTADKNYKRSADIAVLSKSLQDLDWSLSKGTFPQEFRPHGESIRVRLFLKLRLCEYLRDFEDKIADKILLFVEENRAATEEKGYGNAVKIMDDVKGYVTAIAPTMRELFKVRRMLTCGNIRTATLEDISEAIEKLQALKKTAEQMELSSPFGDGVAFDNVSLQGLIDAELTKADKMRLEAMGETIERSLVEVSEPYKYATYYPNRESEEGSRANASIVCTPLRKEAELFAYYAREGGRKLMSVDCTTFMTDSMLKDAFAYAADKNYDLIIFSPQAVREESLNEFYLSAIRYGKSGKYAFIVDESGEQKIYKQAVKAAESTDEVSDIDISRDYISMPYYRDVEKELSARGMLNTAEDFERLKNAPFMGFNGLNEVIKAQVAGGRTKWYEVARRCSQSNESKARAYLDKIASSYLFIDSGWGDFEQRKNNVVDDEHGPFDYDGVKDVDMRNVRKIIESGESVFARCGMIAYYCTTGGSDRSLWAELSLEEMSERVTLATQLVMRILGVAVQPKVEILEELENPTAGGTCYEGGKRIVYRHSCAKSLDWMTDAIVHESFHALQAKLRNGGWSRWYYENMGISRGRVEEWRNTNSIYDGNTGSDVYKVHIKEADARAFEVDCKDGRAECWSGLNLE